ncbi:MAG: hypothetical protein CSA79_03470 [Thiothrix nivea]|nr:MAG: hypothetical protein CSA79_03470 [Thiothrix nivea]
MPLGRPVLPVGLLYPELIDQQGQMLFSLKQKNPDNIVSKKLCYTPPRYFCSGIMSKFNISSGQWNRA